MLFTKKNVKLLTPRKEKKGLKPILSKDCYSVAVSQVRQPIESFFNWLEVKTQIQNAAKPRSMKGLIVHVFGKLLAAMIAMVILK